MHPHSQLLLFRLVRDRIQELHREAEAARAAHLLAPGERGLRRRIARRLQSWAVRLDPELLEAPRIQRIS